MMDKRSIREIMDSENERVKKKRKQRDKKRSWDVLGNDMFMCRICKRTISNKWRGSRVGVCKYCMGDE